MEPECQGEGDDLGFQKFIEGEFETLAINLSDFQNAILPPPRPIGLEDVFELSEPSFTHHECNPKLAQSIQHQLAMLQRDFDGFENSELPPFLMDPMCVQSSAELEFKRGSTQNVNVTTMKYADATTYGGGGGVGGGRNVISEALRRRKRKYRGVYESEAEAALRIERQKIKNRVAAAQAYQKKQAYQLQLKAQIQTLHKDNDFQKKLLMLSASSNSSWKAI